MEKLTLWLKEKRGRNKELANALGISTISVHWWFNRDPKRIPIDRVADIERITGISRHDLRPDIFGTAP